MKFGNIALYFLSINETNFNSYLLLLYRILYYLQRQMARPSDPYLPNHIIDKNLLFFMVMLLNGSFQFLWESSALEAYWKVFDSYRFLSLEKHLFVSRIVWISHQTISIVLSQFFTLILSFLIWANSSSTHILKYPLGIDLEYSLFLRFFFFFDPAANLRTIIVELSRHISIILIVLFGAFDGSHFQSFNLER